jgi:hypothetical protein
MSISTKAFGPLAADGEMEIGSAIQEKTAEDQAIKP